MLFTRTVIPRYNAGEGEMEGACTGLHYPKDKDSYPKATHYYKDQNRWVCFDCAQKVNTEFFQLHRKYPTKGQNFNDLLKRKPCISAKERVFEILAA